MALAIQPTERKEVRPEIPEAQNPITGDLKPHLIAQIKTIMRLKLAQGLDMPEDSSFEDLRMEEHRRDKVRKYHLRKDAIWGRIVLSSFRRWKKGIIEFPEPGKTWKDEIGENLRQQRIQELGLPENTTWEDIEVAIAAYVIRKKLSLPPNASLRNASFTLRGFENG